MITSMSWTTNAADFAAHAAESVVHSLRAKLQDESSRAIKAELRRRTAPRRGTLLTREEFKTVHTQAGVLVR